VVNRETDMLEIRFLRSGRRNAPFFRIVLTESSKPPKSGFIKILGWYNPKTKDSSLKKEEILEWLNKGAKPSNSLSKLLERNKVSHKLIKFVPAKPKAKKVKEEKKPKPAPPKLEEENQVEEKVEVAPEKPEEKTGEVVEKTELEAKNKEENTKVEK